VILYVGKQN